MVFMVSRVEARAGSFGQMGEGILQFETPLLDRLLQVLAGQPEFLGATVLKTVLRKFGGQVVLLSVGAQGDLRTCLSFCLSFWVTPSRWKRETLRACEAENGDGNKK